MALIKNIGELKAKKVGIDTILDEMRYMLKYDIQKESVVINEGGEVLENSNVYWALRFLGARLASVSFNAAEVVEAPLEFLGFYDEVSSIGVRTYENPLELVYKDRPTPILKLNGLIKDEGIRLWGKLEFYNPFSFSIKDRVAWYMIENSEEAKEKDCIIEASSGNTGIAIAAISSINKKRSKIYVPANPPRYVERLLSIYGSEFVIKGSSTDEIIGEAIEEARLCNAYAPNQFKNIFNVLVHVRFTAKEVEYQARFSKAKLKGVFASMGTGGHVAGLSFYFHNRGQVKVYGVQPKGGKIPGIKRQNFDNWWGIEERPDYILEVTPEDAIKASVLVARSNGVLPGLSGGAVVSAFLKAYHRGLLEEGDYVVIIPDSGIKYLEAFDTYIDR